MQLNRICDHGYFKRLHQIRHDWRMEFSVHIRYYKENENNLSRLILDKKRRRLAQKEREHVDAQNTFC